MAENHDREAPTRPAAGTARHINKTERQSDRSRQHCLNPSYLSSNARRSRKTGFGLNRPNHPTLHSALPRNTPSHLLPQRPQYSLAGNLGQAVHNQSYVDPRYYDYNPSYRNPRATPVWGLAKPLPRVVRPGMRRDDRSARDEEGRVVEKKSAELDAPGSAEAIPQLGMIDEQRQEDGKEPIGEPTNKDNRGYGHQFRRKESRLSSKRTVNIAGGLASENSLVDRYGTPKDERSNPMEELRFPSSYPVSDPFDDVKGDLGERRLGHSSGLSEVTSDSPSVYDAKDAQNIDLEAGENSDDWPLEDGEEEQYIQEEDDMHNSWASIRARFREPLAECLAVSDFPCLSPPVSNIVTDHDSIPDRPFYQSISPNISKYERNLYL